MGRGDRFGFLADGCAVLLLVVAFFGTFQSMFEVNRTFVHPTYLDSILTRAAATGPFIHWMDLANSIYQFGPEESRPRILAILVELWDIKLRLFLHRFLPIPPTLMPISWLLQVIAGVWLLFKLVRNLGGDRIAATVASAVYLSTIGFQSGLTMAFIPGKALVTVALLAAMYALSTISRDGAPTRFSDAPTSTKVTAILAVLISLYLDEVGTFAFVLLPIMFWPLFWDSTAATLAQKPDWRGIALCALPAIVFLVSVAIVLPVFYRIFFNAPFDYFGNVFAYGVGSLGAKSVFEGPYASFGWPVLWQNFANFFGLATVPLQVSPFSHDIPDNINLAQVSNVPQLLGIAVFFLVVGMCATRPITAAAWLRRTLLATLVFVVLMTLLSIRHNPIIAGYYYGATISLFIALLVGLAVAILAQYGSAWRLVAVVLAAPVVFVQLNNFVSVNQRWRFVHNEIALRGANEKQIDLLPKGTEVTGDELAGIRAAWKDNKLDAYLKHHAITAGAIYLVYELRTLDRLYPRPVN